MKSAKLDDAEILAMALKIAESRLTYGQPLCKPDDVANYLRMWAANLTEEAFGAIWLDARHRVLATDTLFYGTIDGASVYTRPILRKALDHNAAAAVIFHNHPSGDSEPSAADRTLTERVKLSLDCIQVRLLDHFVIGARMYSFAEHGLL